MPADIEYLQGNWQVEALEINGVALPATGSIAVKGNQFSATGMGGEYTGRVEIRKPNRISLHFLKAPKPETRITASTKSPNPAGVFV